MTKDELIAALERAEGPDRALFEQVWAAIEGMGPSATLYDCGIHGTRPGHPDRQRAQRFLDLIGVEAWLDAALTLVPEGYQHGYATIPDDDILRAGHHRAQAYVDGSKMQDFSKYHRAESSTPAIALCIAALRSRGDA